MPVFWTGRVFDGFNHGILLEPPKRINRPFYKCEKCFILDDILEMYKAETTHGIALISGKGAYLYTLTQSGEHLEYKLLYSKNVKLQGKTRRGGQSASRIDRNREIKKGVYRQTIVDQLISVYMDSDKTSYLIKDLLLSNIKKNLF